MTAPPVDFTDLQAQPGFASGSSASQMKAHILDWCCVHSVPMTRALAQRLGVRMCRRQERIDTVADFERELRILGIYRDDTARDAVRNMERSS